MTWYLAICLDCKPVLPQPFSVEKERDDWTEAHHKATGHGILLATQTDKEREAS